MAVTNPKYDIDMTGLDNLFTGVVAYIEVRSGFEDISNEIAREMRQMGAVVSDKRDGKVTHVIFREGTLRTSNWAKKHNIPLVGIGWLAASARKKMKFLCAPWREEYLVEKLDVCGLKKKMRYKKYCKAMNVEEFEEEMNKSAEKIKKKLEKSMDKTKSSVDSGDLEFERVMKLSDPCRRPRPPTPEFVKKHQRRQERLKQGGRYSWESSDEEKTDSNEGSDKSKRLEAVNEPLLNSNAQENMDNLNKSDSKDQIRNKSSRHLFKDDSDNSNKNLIDPISSNKIKSLKTILPKAVQMVAGIISGGVKKKRKLLAQTDDAPQPKKCKNNANLDIVLPNKQHSTVTTTPPSFIAQLFKTPPLIRQKLVSKTPLSPLVTNKASPIREDCFTTPNRRLSLRSRLLRSSAKKRYMENPDNANRPFSREILVPETVFADRKFRPRQSMVSPTPNGDFTIPETPMISNNYDSFTSSTLGDIFDTPNASNYLNEIIPDRVKGNGPINHVLFVAKDPYLHSSRALTPDFKPQIKYASENFPREQMEKIVEIISNQPSIIAKNDDGNFKSKRNVRRSVRLSKCLENNTIQSSYNEDEAESVKEEEVSVVMLEDIGEKYYSQTQKEENIRIKLSEISNKDTEIGKDVRKSIPDCEFIDLCKNVDDGEDLNIFKPKESDLTLNKRIRRSVRLSKPLESNTIKPSNSETVLNPIFNESVKEEEVSVVMLEDIGEKYYSQTQKDENIRIKLSEISNKNTEIRKNVRKSIPDCEFIDLSKNDDDEEDLNIFKPKESDLMSNIHLPSNKTSDIAKTSVNNKPLEKKPNLKRYWSEVNKENKTVVIKQTQTKKKTAKTKKFRDSTDDFSFSPKLLAPPGKIVSKSLIIPIINEIVFTGFDTEELLNLKASLCKLTRKFTCVDIIRSKEQLIVVPQKPRKSLDLIKAFIFGNTFVNVSWITESSAAKKLLSYTPYIVTYSDITQLPLTRALHSSQIFKDYTPMYISTSTKSRIPKYKLKLIIEQFGGTVTDSFRQAGLVIDTRKVNALSVTSSWVLDCVNEDRIIDPLSYTID